MQTDFFKTNPFLGTDAFKTFAQFTPAKMADEFFKAARQYRFAPADMDAILESQRKTVEALSAANRAATEGVQKIAKRQVEIVKETLDEMSGAFSAIAQAGTFEDAAAKQAELAKEVFETALENGREVAEMLTESSEAVTEALSSRVVGIFDEVKANALKLKVKEKAERPKAA